MVDFRDKVTFERFINEQHFGMGKSLRLIERELGTGNAVVQGWCKRHGIKVRSRIEAAAKSMAETKAAGKMSGKNHWAYGLCKETHPAYAAHSKRMKEHNPSSLPGVIERILKEVSKLQLENAPLGEAMFSTYLSSLGIAHERQFIEGKSVRDFAFPSEKIIIELDGKGHASRKDTDLRKDLDSVSRGWIVIRVPFCNRKPSIDWHRLILVLKQLIPGLDHVSTKPTSIRSQYRMLIRYPDNPTGFSMYDTDDPAFVRLVHDRRNRHEASSVG